MIGPAPKWVRIRVYAAAAVLIGLFGGVTYKAWSVQIRDGGRMRALGQAQYLQSMEIPAPRGTIQAANGVELAVSVYVDSVWANPREVADPARTARLLGRVLDVNARDLEARLRADRGFVWVRRRVSPEQARAVREAGLAGIGLIPEAKRYYPGGSIAGPVLGFAGLDGKGLDGLEMFLDERLRGAVTQLPALRDGRGQLVLAGGAGDPATSGATVTLTIDRFIQFAAERVLADTIAENRAKAGIIVVLDPRTGDVLGLATWPTFDPNDPASRGDARNRSITDAYEPGSVMKVFSVAAAIDAGVVKPTDLVNIAGGLTIGGHTISDTHKGESVVTVSHVIKVSSNVGAGKIALRLGPDRLAEALRRFGFGKKTGVELPGERSGVVRDPRRWGQIGLATIAFGYGMTATPLQIAAGYAAMANGGVRMPPGVVKRVVAADGRVLYERRPEGERVLSDRAARDMVAMMKSVMEEGGTGERIKVPGFVGGGKTGTAHKVDPATGRYAKDKYLASFVGFMPADDPRLVVAVMIDEPHPSRHFGGTVSGPAFARLADECLKYLGVEATVPVPSEPEPEPEPEPELAVDQSDLPPLAPGEPIVVIPDFTGMSMAQALEASRAAGVTLEVEGSGRAVQQFPPPGRALRSVACTVTFEPR